MITDEVLSCIIAIGLFCILMGTGMIFQYAILLRKEHETWRESFKTALKCFFGIDDESHQ